MAHDWGGAVAWNLANQLPHLTKKLAIINSPHPGTFLRELKSNPKQQAASAYMNFLIRPDAEQLLREDDYRRLWQFFTNWGGGALADRRAEAPIPRGLGCQPDRRLQLLPRLAGAAAECTGPGGAGDHLPREMLTVDMPTLVLWAMDDVALPPELIEGLEEYVPQLTLEKVAGRHALDHPRAPGLRGRAARPRSCSK